MMKKELQEVESHLKSSVLGQDQAIDKVMVLLRRHWAGLSNLNRPIGRFIAVGPTGVGKTWLAESLAAALFNIPTARQLCGENVPLLRINCAEMHLEHHSARLLGAPPGYIGHDTTPPIFSTDNIERVTSVAHGLPAGVCIFDEIEKAHPFLFRLLLGVLDTAKLTNAQGQTVSFHNMFVFFTSNLGTGSLPSGFMGSSPHEAIHRAVRKHFSEEFLNRIDHIAVFDHLDDSTKEAILNSNLCNAVDRLKQSANVSVNIGQNLKLEILKRGTSCRFGARGLQRAIDSMVVDSVIEYLVKVENRDTLPPQLTVDYEYPDNVVIRATPVKGSPIYRTKAAHV